MRTEIKRKITTESFYEFNGDDIISALVDSGKLPPAADFTITFKVPGGGDYSNMSVDIDASNPIKISCKEVIEENE